MLVFQHKYSPETPPGALYYIYRTAMHCTAYTIQEHPPRATYTICLSIYLSISSFQ